MAKSFREKLRSDIIILDGGFGTYIQSLGLTDKDFGDHPGCMEYLALTRPDLITRVHHDYLEAGSDAVETDTFGGNAIKLAEYGLEGRVYEINKAATELARKEADSFSTTFSPRYVVGTMGPSGKLPSSIDPVLGNISYDELKKAFREQALGIIDGGADAILVETGQDLLEMKAAVNGAKEAIREKGKDLVLMAQCTLANNGRMLLGTEISAVVGSLTAVGVDVIGLNCSMGPREMETAVKYLSENSSAAVSCVPNAGLPEECGGKVVYPLGPEEMARIVAEFARKYRVDIIGGCCGTTPEHIRQMKKAVIPVKKKNIPKYVLSASSFRGFDLGMMKRPIKVGERVNTQGSRKMKELLLASDYDGIVELGKAQQRAGADLLDVCAVLTERHTEKNDSVILTSRLAESVTVPLMIDSTDVGVIEEALKKYPGTAFINSANLEDGGEKARRIFLLAKEHGAFVVNLVIDEDGMARTVEKKLEVAGRLIDIACGECGLPRERMIFDLLTFTLATGEAEFADSALCTIEAIKQVKKKYFGVLTALGVSNVSFGLSKSSRSAVNASFLHHTVKAGLDFAIVNPSDLPDYERMPLEERRLADSLVLNRRADALQNIVDYFSAKMAAQPRPQDGDGSESQAVPIEEKLKKCIFDRDKTRIVPLVQEALETMNAQKIINDVLMAAMKDVGDKLDSGEMVLPYVLQAAEVMRMAIEYLEKFLPKEEGVKKGKVLLATVAGDVHDIGKNLVKMILENNGFAVLDLGKQVHVETIIAEAEKHMVDAVGLSALLVSTARHMKTCVRSLHEAGLDYPVMIGGAPINEDFASDISILADGSTYSGGVFYARDAFTGLRLMQALMDKGGRIEKMGSYRSKVEEYKEKKGVPAPESAPERTPEPQVVPKPAAVPEPPFYGARAVPNVPADEVFALLDEKALFERSWSAKLKDTEKKEELIENEFRPVLKELKEEMLHKGWLDLKAVYGYFKCRVSGTDMKVVDKGGTILAKFAFGQASGERPRELTDYFTAGPGVDDLVIFQAVTVGSRINAAISKLNEDNELAKAFYLHGLAVNLAEALAEYVHRRIRAELGLKEDQGRRYSPGYPLWRDLGDQSKIFKLLDVENKIGVKLTEDHQMVPEASTTAMVVYSEKAEY